MITIILSGGLGNQMFQYASGKALATRLNTGMRLDLSFFEVFKNKSWCRPYELGNVFNIDVSLFSSASINNKIWFTALTKYRYKSLGRWIKKLSLVYDSTDDPLERWYQCHDNTKLWGSFAKEVYFRDYQNEILKEFQFKAPLDEHNETIANLIQTTNPVSVHIRRGDYLNEVNSKVFAPISPGWYHAAIQMTKEKAGATHFFFFSDDMEWTRQTFGDIENATFVDWNHGADSYKDMQLMSLCKHNIITNSTFSWWGAWLNTNPNKMVIAPSVFFNNEKANETYRQNMPKDWILYEPSVIF